MKQTIEANQNITSLSDQNPEELSSSADIFTNAEVAEQYAENTSPYSSTKLINQWMQTWGKIIIIVAIVIATILLIVAGITAYKNQ